MKFYNYSNINKNYTKAISLNNVRSVEVKESSGKSAVRFSVEITYCDNNVETFRTLNEQEAVAVQMEIVNLLNQ